MTAKWPLMDRFWAPELAKQALLLGGQYWRLEMPFGQSRLPDCAWGVSFGVNIAAGLYFEFTFLGVGGAQDHGTIQNAQIIRPASSPTPTTATKTPFRKANVIIDRLPSELSTDIGPTIRALNAAL